MCFAKCRVTFTHLTQTHPTHTQHPTTATNIHIDTPPHADNDEDEDDDVLLFVWLVSVPAWVGAWVLLL